MLNNIQHILVVLNHGHAEQHAFDRALFLARSLKADITLVTNIWNAYGDHNDTLDADTQEQLRGALVFQAEEWLESFVHDAHGVNVKSVVVWHKHLHEAVVELCNITDFDLVIKGSGQHNLVDRIFTHIDWNLIRHCPTPVLLVKSGNAWKHNRLLACIDAGAQDTGHKLINDNILSFAEHISDHFDTDLHLVNAYPMINTAFALVPEVNIPADIQEDVHVQHEEICAKWANKYNIQMDHVHIAGGNADEVVADVAKDIQADLLVIGTVGRSGLAGVLIGNTAELLVDKVQCDVMVIKPSNGVDPNY